MEEVDQLPRDQFAGLTRRIVAFAVDVAIGAVVVALVLVVLTIVAGGEIRLEGRGALVMLLWVALSWEVGWGVLGGKPGQRLAGFALVGVDGRTLPASRSVIRGVVKCAGWFFPLTYAVSLVLVARHPRGQSLHDLAAGSVCVERAGWRLLRSASLAGTQPPAPPPQAPSPPSDRDTSQHRGPFL